MELSVVTFVSTFVSWNENKYKTVKVHLDDE